MKYFLSLLLLCLSVFFANTSFADVYSWKDENGVMHYTDTPPSERAVSDKQLSIMKTPKSSFYNNYYKKDGEDEYCGTYRMPSYDDPRVALINAYHHAASGYDNKRFYKKQYSRLLSGEDRIYSRTKQIVKFGGRQKIEKSIGECDCRIQWNENKIVKLNPYIDIILKEAEVSKLEYNDSIPDCGEKPSGGWHTDQAAIDWFNCTYDKEKQAVKTKKRKASKNATSMKKSLLSAIKTYNAKK